MTLTSSFLSRSLFSYNMKTSWFSEMTHGLALLRMSTWRTSAHSRHELLDVFWTAGELLRTSSLNTSLMSSTFNKSWTRFFPTLPNIFARSSEYKDLDSCRT